MQKDLFVNGELALHRNETHGKRKSSNMEPVFSSRMEKREYYKNVHWFDIRNVLDSKKLLNDIKDNFQTYVSKVNQLIQNSTIKKLVVTGIFMVILGFNSLSANAAWVQEYTYQVKNGDKIEEIAMDHGVTTQEILDANGMTSIDGKKILLPLVQDYKVTATVLNVRSQPSTESSVITKYKKGHIAKVAFIENGWAGILIEGRLFYVSADYLTKIENEKSNLHKGLIEYVIKSGDTFSKIGRSVGVSASAIQELNPTVDPTKLKIGQKLTIPVITTNAIIYDTPVRTMYVTASSLRVRESASTSSPTLGKLKTNESVLVNFIENGWAQIDFNGKTAFVSESYLTDKKPRQSNNDHTSKDSSEYVIKAGDTFSKVGRSLGVSTSAIQELNPIVDPTKLRIGQKITIPVSTTAIKNGSPEKTMYVTASSLRIREAASTSSSILGKLKINETVLVKDIENGWAQIDFNEKTAFVSESYLTDKNPGQAINSINDSSEYVIKAGDTFNKIGRMLGVSATAIQELNPTTNPTKLKIGQTIYIPATITNNQINVVAHVAGINPNGVFRFITSDGKTYAAQSSGNLINELFQKQGKKTALTLQGKRGQQLTLISLN